MKKFFISAILLIIFNFLFFNSVNLALAQDDYSGGDWSSSYTPSSEPSYSPPTSNSEPSSNFFQGVGDFFGGVGQWVGNTIDGLTGSQPPSSSELPPTAPSNDINEFGGVGNVPYGPSLPPDFVPPEQNNTSELPPADYNTTWSDTNPATTPSDDINEFGGVWKSLELFLNNGSGLHGSLQYG